MQLMTAQKPQNKFPAVMALGRTKMRLACFTLYGSSRVSRSDMAASGLFGEGLEVFPKLRVLLHQLRFRDRQFVAQQEVFEGVLMQNVERVQGVAVHVEVEPEISRSQPVQRLPAAIEAAERFPGMGQVGWSQTADRLDRSHLRELIQLVQLQHALFGERDLKHDANGQLSV